MNSYSDKAKKSTFQSAAGSLVAENIASTGPFLTDNRPRFTIQKKDISKTNGTVLPIQLKSDVKNTPQTYNFDGETVTVGKKMEAWLDPNDQLQGESANLNTSQDDMMAAIRKKYKLTGGEVVKGHLLNDNLGGVSEGKNLYPITMAANKDHLTHVENFSKDYVWGAAKIPIFYTVEVKGIPNINSSHAEFITSIQEWDIKKKGHKGGKDLEPKVTVHSNLPKPKDFGQAFELGKPGVKAKKAKNPKKPKGFKRPYKRVIDLPPDRKKARLDDK
jgi:hypothetical protein